MIEVLLIDDDADEYIIFLRAIRYFDEPMRCIYAHSAKQAFEILKYRQPRFIFVNINMPKTNGLECIKKLNGLSKGLSQLVVIYSTYMNEVQYQSAKMAGAADCLKKTNSIPLLVEKIAPYLSTVG